MQQSSAWQVPVKKTFISEINLITILFLKHDAGGNFSRQQDPQYLPNGTHSFPRGFFGFPGFGRDGFGRGRDWAFSTRKGWVGIG